MAQSHMNDVLNEIMVTDKKKEDKSLNQATGVKHSLMKQNDMSIDVVSQELLAYYERTTNTSKNDIIISLQPKAEMLLEQRQKKQEEALALREKKEIGLQLNKQGANLNTKQVENKMEEARKQQSDPKVSLEEEIEKAIYEAMLEEYHTIVGKLYTQYPNGMMYTGDPSMGEGNATKCLLYEKKLAQMRNKYPAIVEDEQIQEKETHYFYREAAYKQAVFKTSMQDRRQIDQMQARVRGIEEDIVQLSLQAGDMDSRKFKEQMDQLQHLYVGETVKLRALEPDPEEMYLQDERYMEERADRVDTLGREQIVQEEKRGGSTHTVKNQEEQIEKSRDGLQDIEQEKIQALKEMLQKAKMIRDRNEEEVSPELLELLESMEAILGDTVLEVDTIENHQNDKTVSRNAAEQKEAKSPEKEEELGSFEQELNRVYTPKQAQVNERLSRIEEGIDGLEGKTQVIEKDIERIR